MLLYREQNAAACPVNRRLLNSHAGDIAIQLLCTVSKAIAAKNDTIVTELHLPLMCTCFIHVSNQSIAVLCAARTTFSS